MSKNLRVMTRLAALTAVSIVLAYIELPPFLPAAPFLQLNFSDVPVLIGGIVYGFPGAFCVLIIANLFHMLVSHTAFVGELANVIVGTALFWTFTAFGRGERVPARVWRSVAAAVSITLAGVLANNFILLPFFGIPAEARPALLPWIALFNAIKGSAVCLIVCLLPGGLYKFMRGEK